MKIQIINLFTIAFIYCIVIISVSCSKDSGTDSPTPSGQGIGASDFAFRVGNEWNYNGTGYSASGSVVSKSLSTGKLRIISETNSNGLNGYKLYGTFKDWLGHTKGNGEGFISTENNGLWILERLANGSTSPTKILPFGVNNATVRSEIFSRNWWWSNEVIKMSVDIKFEHLGTENINVTAGGFSNCKKIKVLIDVSQKSDTNGVEIFNGKTWNVESLWWLSVNNGLIKTQTSFNCVVDSVLSWIWDPITGEWKYIYKSILESNIYYGVFRHFDVEDLMIPVTHEWYKTKISGLNYLGRYVTELSSKNF